jgi:putative transposase
MTLRKTALTECVQRLAGAVRGLQVFRSDILEHLLLKRHIGNKAMWATKFGKERWSCRRRLTPFPPFEVLMTQANLSLRPAGIRHIAPELFCWHKESGDLEFDRAKRIKDLQRESVRLKRQNLAWLPISASRPLPLIGPH